MPIPGATDMVGGLILTNDLLEAELADGESADPFSDGHYIANWNIKGAFEVEIISAAGGKSDRDLDHGARSLENCLNQWFYHDIHYNPPDFITLCVWDARGNVLGNRILPTHGLSGPMYVHLIAAKGAAVQYDSVAVFRSDPGPPVAGRIEKSVSTRPGPLYWDHERLNIEGVPPSADFAATVDLINEARLDEALKLAKTIGAPEPGTNEEPYTWRLPGT